MTRILAILPCWDGMSVTPTIPLGLDPDTEVVFRQAPTGSALGMSAHDWAIADLAVLAAGQAAADEGFDAVCIGDFGDYGVGALRSVLPIPVFGAGRCAMLYAMTLGTKFSVIAPASAYQRCKKLVGEYGFDRQCASVRTIEHSDGKESEGLFHAALSTARLCVEEDSADVLCLGSAVESDFPKRLTQALPVPIIDATALAYKLAESCLGLALSHSRRAYPEPLVRKADLISALVGVAQT
jgi:allantoin racemase